jgi:hypothetical protein
MTANRFADRDMFMRYLGGGVGHKFMWEVDDDTKSKYNRDQGNKQNGDHNVGDNTSQHDHDQSGGEDGVQGGEPDVNGDIINWDVGAGEDDDDDGDRDGDEEGELEGVEDEDEVDRDYDEEDEEGEGEDEDEEGDEDVGAEDGEEDWHYNPWGEFGYDHL